MKSKIKNAAKITKLKSVKAKKIDVPSVKAAKKELTKAEKKVSIKKAQLILAKKAAKK
jgi:hypothetical protein